MNFVDDAFLAIMSEITDIVSKNQWPRFFLVPGRDSRYERKASSKGQPYFVLKVANGEIIGKSEMYTSNSGMENGIASVKKNGPTAEVEDNT